MCVTDAEQVVGQFSTVTTQPVHSRARPPGASHSRLDGGGGGGDKTTGGGEKQQDASAPLVSCRTVRALSPLSVGFPCLLSTGLRSETR